MTHQHTTQAFDTADDLLDDLARDVFVVQGILALSAENRRKLLMFVHLANQGEKIAVDARIEAGSVELRLTVRAH